MNRDNWETPWRIFSPIHEVMGFTIDSAASEGNAKLSRYWAKDDDGLSKDWAGEVVWCNPPYLDQAYVKWIRKAAEGWYTPSCLLIPVATATRVWHANVFGNPILFFKKRIKFLLNGVVLGSPRFDSAAVFFNLTRQQYHDLTWATHNRPDLSFLIP